MTIAVDRSDAGLHVVVRVHDGWRLAECLAGLAVQTGRAKNILISVDGDEPALVDLVRKWAPRLPGDRVGVITRPGTGEWRASQTRNNGVRAIIESGAGDGDQVLFLGADVVLHPSGLERHLALARGGADLVIGFKAGLSESASDRFNAEDYFAGRFAFETLEPPREALEARARVYRRQIWMRRNGLLKLFVKSHKPKVIGCHHAVRLGALKALNGYDEAFVAYGGEDDDLGRRLYAWDPSLRVEEVVAAIPALRFWEGARARPWEGAPGTARFTAQAASGTVRCDRGLEQPLDQEMPRIRCFR